MTVYIESNFVLELAYLQEEHDSCEGLLALAQGGSLDLVLPAFSVTEARSSRVERAHRKREFHDQLERNVRELCRSQPYQELASKTIPFTSALIDSIEAEKTRLGSAVGRLLQACRVISTHASTVAAGIENEERFGLSAADAVILASVLEDLVGRPPGGKCFLNRNSRDFSNPDIEDVLSKHGCRLIPSFKDGLAYVQSMIETKGSKVTSSRAPRADKRSRPQGPGG